MYLDKTQYETSLDLSLYLEGLLKVEEQEVELNAETKVNIETNALNDLIASAFTELAPKIAEKIEEKVEEITSVPVWEEEKSSIPAWGQEPFKCLLVNSAGMNLIIPAMSVSYIERINKKIIRLPLDIEAFRGVITLRERSIAVVDLFALISENASSGNQPSMQVESHHIEHVIVMENGDYSLACDDIGEMIMLETESVRWNKASFNNPMFSGIVPEYLCPIVNIEHVQQQVATMPFVQSLNKNY